MNFRKLIQVVLKKGDLLFLGWTPPTIIRLHLSALEQRWGEKVRESDHCMGSVCLRWGWTHPFNSSREVVNKKLPQVVKGLEFTGLFQEKHRRVRGTFFTVMIISYCTVDTHNCLLQTLHVLFGLFMTFIQISADTQKLSHLYFPLHILHLPLHHPISLYLNSLCKRNSVYVLVSAKSHLSSSSWMVFSWSRFLSAANSMLIWSSSRLNLWLSLHTNTQHNSWAKPRRSRNRQIVLKSF